MPPDGQPRAGRPGADVHCSDQQPDGFRQGHGSAPADRLVVGTTAERRRWAAPAIEVTVLVYRPSSCSWRSGWAPAHRSRRKAEAQGPIGPPGPTGLGCPYVRRLCVLRHEHTQEDDPGVELERVAAGGIDGKKVTSRLASIEFSGTAHGNEVRVVEPGRTWDD